MPKYRLGIISPLFFNAWFYWNLRLSGCVDDSIRMVCAINRGCMHYLRDFRCIHHRHMLFFSLPSVDNSWFDRYQGLCKLQLSEVVTVSKQCLFFLFNSQTPKKKNFYPQLASNKKLTIIFASVCCQNHFRICCLMIVLYLLPQATAIVRQHNNINIS